MYSYALVGKLSLVRFERAILIQYSKGYNIRYLTQYLWCPPPLNHLHPNNRSALQARALMKTEARAGQSTHNSTEFDYKTGNRQTSHDRNHYRVRGKEPQNERILHSEYRPQ